MGYFKDIRSGAAADGPNMSSSRVLAAIDVGTVSTRLIVARVDEAGDIEPIERQATITNLGLNVDKTGRLDPSAVRDTCECVRAYGRRMGELETSFVKGQQARSEAVAIALTSAARDAENADQLLDLLSDIGLDPQIIPGQVEARLSLLGVTGDFASGTRVLVADVGGGSTELSLGLRDARTGALLAGDCRSFDVGCRRITERFLHAGPTDVPSGEQIAAARSFVRDVLGAYFSSASSQTEGESPNPAADVLACVGGTATSLVAIDARLVPYDSSYVHLHRMSRSRVHDLAQRLLAMTLDELRELPGLQPKRAPVIGAGALIIDELLAASGFDAYVASESDSLFGLLRCAYAELVHAEDPLAPLWRARLTDADAFVLACEQDANVR